MSSQDPTPPEGRPRPHTGELDRTGEVRRTDAPVDPLWAPTAEQRAEAERRSTPMGMPSAQREPARAPYGQAPPSQGYATPATSVMPSTDVPRIGNVPGPPYQHAVYQTRPPLDVPVALEQPVPVPPPRKPVWPWVVAVLAIALGALVGWIVAKSDDETVTDAPPTTVVVESTESADPAAQDLGRRLDAALEETRANGAYSDSGIPQLDEIVAIDRAKTAESLQSQVDLLSVAQEQSVARIAELEEEVATLEQSLAEVTAERDELKAEVDSGAMSDTEFLARLQEKEDEISALEDRLATATTQLTEAQTAAQKATDDLRVVQTQLQEANATLQALDRKVIGNYVNTDIGRIRSEASANGWFLVEQQVDHPQATPGVVVVQQPPAGATVIRGSVIYVEYDKS